MGSSSSPQNLRFTIVVVVLISVFGYGGCSSRVCMCRFSCSLLLISYFNLFIVCDLVYEFVYSYLKGVLMMEIVKLDCIAFHVQKVFQVLDVLDLPLLTSSSSWYVLFLKSCNFIMELNE